jgi:hypothetical protein
VIVVRYSGCRRSAGVRAWFGPGRTGLSLCTVETITVLEIQRELTLSFETRFPVEGER